jgi:long-chain acyl-CoA synthetase
MSRDIPKERAEIDRAVEGQTLCSAFAETATRHRDLEALRWRGAQGWSALTWGQYREHVRDLSVGLQALGFGRGSFGAILMRNRPEHAIADLAIVHAGGTPVSLYATLAPEQIAYIVNHCEAAVIFVEDASFLARLLTVRKDLPHLRRIVLIEGDATGEVMHWDDLMETGRAQAASRPDAFDESWRQVGPQDLATLIYTSGTTGPPKAVMIDHRNVCWTVQCGHLEQVIKTGDRQLSYLPMAHVAERFTGHWSSIVNGTTVSFCPDLAELARYLNEVRPTFLFGPPRVWEKLYGGIHAAIAAEPDESRRAAVEAAIAVGRQVVACEQRGEPVPTEVAAKGAAVGGMFTAIRAKVGLDQCRVAMTGAAPIATEVIEFFRAIGLPFTEIWGMSELTGPGSWRLDGFKIGTVGISNAGEEVRLAEDGELLVRGGNVMRGYYKDAVQTAEALDDEGWLRTGDIASIDADGNIRIVDRKKELIITAGGKNISPANLESLLKQHPLIGQACVIGDRRPFLTALLVLDGQVTAAWALKRGIAAPTIAELSAHPEVKAEVERAVAEANQHVSRHEQIKRFTILPSEWTAESEELTPTLKLKRRVILQKYAESIERMYTVVPTPV